MTRLERLEHIKRRWSSMAWLWTAGMVITASVYGIFSRPAWTFFVMVIVAWAARDVVSAMECFLRQAKDRDDDR